MKIRKSTTTNTRLRKLITIQEIINIRTARTYKISKVYNLIKIDELHTFFWYQIIVKSQFWQTLHKILRIFVVVVFFLL